MWVEFEIFMFEVPKSIIKNLSWRINFILKHLLNLDFIALNVSNLKRSMVKFKRV